MKTKFYNNSKMNFLMICQDLGIEDLEE